MFGLQLPSLRFKLFGIPIRLNLMFVLFEFLLAHLVAVNAFGRQRPWTFLVAYVVVSFISILMITMAHVLMGRWFGMPGEVHFESMGAHAHGEYPRLKGWQRFLVAAAGPLTGWGLYFFSDWLRLYVAGQAGIPPAWQLLANESVKYFRSVTWYYALFRSLPIQPLPGGDMVREIFLWISPRRGLALSYFQSMVCAAGFIAYTLIYQRDRFPGWFVLWPIFIFGSLLLENGKHWIVTMRENAKRRREREGPPLPPRDPEPAAREPYDDPNADPYARRL